MGVLSKDVLVALLLGTALGASLVTLGGFTAFFLLLRASRENFRQTRELLRDSQSQRELRRASDSWPRPTPDEVAAFDAASAQHESVSSAAASYPQKATRVSVHGLSEAAGASHAHASPLLAPAARASGAASVSVSVPVPKLNLSSIPPLGHPADPTNALPREAHFDCTITGFGTLRVLPDWLITRILEELEPRDLLVLSLVSKAMYVMAEQDSLWKTQTLLKYQGDFRFKGSWKRTCLMAPGRFADRPLHRLHVAGVHNVHLLRKWYRSNIPLSHFETTLDQIPRRAGVSVRDFIDQFDRPCRPVILTDVATKWPAFTEWTIDKLTERVGDCRFNTDESLPGGGRLKMKFRDYVQYMLLTHDEDPIYLFDRKFAKHAPTLLNDYSVPIYFQEDVLSVLGDNRPPFQWLVIGPARSGSAFHIDPNGTSAWNAVLQGRKRWLFYPPGVIPPGCGIAQDDDGSDKCVSPKPLKWLLEHYPYLPPDRRPIEVVQKAGEIIFVPGGWWHMVLNLDHTVSVTQNFANSQNFELVWRELCKGENEYHDPLLAALYPWRHDLFARVGVVLPGVHKHPLPWEQPQQQQQQQHKEAAQLNGHAEQPQQPQKSTDAVAAAR